MIQKFGKSDSECNNIKNTLTPFINISLDCAVKNLHNFHYNLLNLNFDLIELRILFYDRFSMNMYDIGPFCREGN